MDWTEIKITVNADDVDRAGDIAHMAVPYGIYIEDYRTLEEEAWQIARIDLIDEDLLAKDRSKGIVHIYISKNGTVVAELPLEIAGLMSSKSLIEVNDLLENAKAAAYSLGVGTGIDPFMTLSFMALPVIPTVRLTTRGVVDVVTQQYL